MTPEFIKNNLVTDLIMSKDNFEILVNHLLRVKDKRLKQIGKDLDYQVNPQVVFEVTRGDSNDVYDKTIVKGNYREVEAYVKSQFSKYGKTRMEDLGSDSIGFGILNRHGDYDFYVEAVEIEDYSDIEIDLGVE